MKTKLNNSDRAALYEKGWFPVPTYNKCVHHNFFAGNFTVKRIRRNFEKSQVYFSFTPKGLRAFEKNVPAALRIEECFKTDKSLRKDSQKLTDRIRICYAQYIYNSFLKRELTRDRTKYMPQLSPF